MNGEIQMHDVVALLEDTPTKHFESGRDILLRRGQMGCVVMTYDGSAFEVEFAGTDGRAYAILPIPRHKLMVLRNESTFSIHRFTSASCNGCSSDDLPPCGSMRSARCTI